VARAGAVTCSELLVCGVPSLLIPSPNVTADHQRVNGRAMLATGSAELLDEDQLTSAALAQRVRALLAVRAVPYPLGISRAEQCRAVHAAEAVTQGVYSEVHAGSSKLPSGDDQVSVRVSA
jgi:UDP-N-acetylglucosamine:LPS N-acetylglucosamine transferase